LSKNHLLLEVQDIRQMKIYHCYSRMAKLLRSNRGLFRGIFGFEPPEASRGQYWDWTTLALRGSMIRFCQDGMEVLDMGCGAYAVLARFARARFACKSITAVDSCKDVIDFASESDSTPLISYHHSDLFDCGLGLFDLIVFNAPYLVEQKAEELGMIQDEEFRERFCGGTDGAATIRSFLANCPKHLKADGLVLLGVNHYHIKAEVIQAAISRSALKPAEIRFNHFTKACVYALRMKSNAKM